jgi:hypothetical protein
MLSLMRVGDAGSLPVGACRAGSQAGSRGHVGAVYQRFQLVAGEATHRLGQTEGSLTKNPRRPKPSSGEKNGWGIRAKSSSLRRETGRFSLMLGPLA